MRCVSAKVAALKSVGGRGAVERVVRGQPVVDHQCDGERTILGQEGVKRDVVLGEEIVQSVAGVPFLEVAALVLASLPVLPALLGALRVVRLSAEFGVDEIQHLVVQALGWLIRKGVREVAILAHLLDEAVERQAAFPEDRARSLVRRDRAGLLGQPEVAQFRGRFQAAPGSDKR